MRKVILLVLTFALMCACPKVQNGVAERTFQLVYHSDTRGYIQPCG